MVLRYMISDTDLVKVELKMPEKEVRQPRRKDVQPTRKLDQAKRNRPSIGQQFRAFCLFLAFSIFLSGIAVLAYQGFVWLKYGYWKTFGSRLVLDKVLPINLLQWLHNPHSWSGFNKIISSVFNSSLAMLLLVFGLVVYLLVAKAFDLFSKPKKTEIEAVHTGNWRRT